MKSIVQVAVKTSGNKTLLRPADGTASSLPPARISRKSKRTILPTIHVVHRCALAHIEYSFTRLWLLTSADMTTGPAVAKKGREMA